LPQRHVEESASSDERASVRRRSYLEGTRLSGEGYSGPLTLTDYERFQAARDALAKGGIMLPVPTGN